MDIQIEELGEYIKATHGNPKFLYLDLYIRRVKLVIFNDVFFEHIYNQIPLVVSKDNSDVYDATIVLWKEVDLSAPPLIYEIDTKNQIYYCGYKYLEYENFIKYGPILVQTFYQILKTDHSSIVHGAVVGLNGDGVLLCAKGQRGKSTLTVLSMLKGMEYVSDDFLLLIKEDENLYAYPIYSIITLSPFMSKKFKERLIGCKKLGLNGTGDKYVYNIENMHGNFRIRYPVKFIMFPEIVDDEYGFIKEASGAEKGRAITQFLHSSVMQMNDVADKNVTKKLLNMVSCFDCYYFGLCKDVEYNSDLLISFMNERKYEKVKN